MAFEKGTLLLVVAALGSGSAAAYFTNSYITDRVRQMESELESRYEPLEVVVPRRDLNVGDVIGYDNLAVREVPRDFVPATAVLPREVDEVVGKQAVAPMGGGDPLLRSLLSQGTGGGLSTLIESGKRAITFQVDLVSSVSGMLRPGDHIDLLATLSSRGGTVTIPLLLDVPVIATDDELRTTLRGKTGRFQTITLMVDPQDAVRISHARESGSLTVVLRSAEGGETTRVSRVTDATLLRTSRSPGRQSRRVEIILGGVK